MCIICVMIIVAKFFFLLIFYIYFQLEKYLSDSNAFILVSTCEEIPGRLKSASSVRSLPPASILTIPEPKFVTPILPATTNPVPQSSLKIKPKTRAASAIARLYTTASDSNEQPDNDIKQQHRDIRSAQGIRQKTETKLCDKDSQKASNETCSDLTQPRQQQSPVVPPTPVSPKVYQGSISCYPNESPSTRLNKKPFRAAVQVNPIPLNPYYIHRPGIISVDNIDKKPVIRESSASKKPTKHHRRHHRHHEKRNEPLLALTSMSQSSNLPVEMDGIKLTYDPSLTLDDPSLNLTKYVIEGRLYLIKDQCYNVLENIDPAFIEKYNQNLM